MLGIGTVYGFENRKTVENRKFLDQKNLRFSCYTQNRKQKKLRFYYGFQNRKKPYAKKLKTVKTVKTVTKP